MFGWLRGGFSSCVYFASSLDMSTFLVRDLISKDSESCALEGGGP